VRTIPFPCAPSLSRAHHPFPVRTIPFPCAPSPARAMSTWVVRVRSWPKPGRGGTRVPNPRPGTVAPSGAPASIDAALSAPACGGPGRSRNHPGPWPRPASGADCRGTRRCGLASLRRGLEICRNAAGQGSQAGAGIRGAGFARPRCQAPVSGPGLRLWHPALRPGPAVIRRRAGPAGLAAQGRTSPSQRPPGPVGAGSGSET